MSSPYVFEPVKVVSVIKVPFAFAACDLLYVEEFRPPPVVICKFWAPAELETLVVVICVPLIGRVLTV